MSTKVEKCSQNLADCQDLCEQAMQVWMPSAVDAGDSDFLRGITWNFSETLGIEVDKTEMEKTWNEAKKKIDDENKPKPSAPTRRTLAAGIFKTRVGRELQGAATTPATPAATTPTASGTGSLDRLKPTFSDSGYAVTMYNKSKRLRAINMGDIWTPKLKKVAKK